MKVSRPVLRYHGGKWRVADWISSHFPRHRIYVEPYGGSASVLLRKPRVYSEVYNDLDGQVVNLFRILRDPGQASELRRLVELTPFARAEFLEAYEPSTDPVERARRLLVRSWMGMGTAAATCDQKTGFRSDVKRRGSTAATDWSRWPEAVPAIVQRLRGVAVENDEASRVILRHDSPGTLFYVDPTYPMDTRSEKSKGYRHEMTDDDHRTLAGVLHAVRGMVVLSGYACELYDRELYPTWRRSERATHADRARKRTEVLWLSPATSRALGQRSLFDSLPA